MFYLDLFQALGRHRVRHVLVGGLAINLHGVERATMDVDLALAITADNLSRAVDAFEELGLVPVAPVAANEARDPASFVRWRDEKRMVAFGWRPTRAPGPVVDCLTALPVAFDDLWSRASVKRLGAIDVRVADRRPDRDEAGGRTRDRPLGHRGARASTIARGGGTVTRRVDFSYTISDERLRAYARVPLLDRLRWLDELCRFTLMWRAAPAAPPAALESPEARPASDTGA